MIRKYPHDGFIILKNVTSNTPDDGLTGYIQTDNEKYPVKGRFELQKSTAVNYGAVFYMEKLDITPFKKDGVSFEYEGRTFSARFSQHQTHTEIWLN
mgnify:CR=1 FL=1